MARINLLPWREEQRKQRRQQFVGLLAVAVLIAGAAMGGVHFYIDDRIQAQNARNQFLEREIARLDRQIKEIQALEKTKQRLLARMETIQRLQASRPEIVHLFDELAKTLPEGVYLTQVKQDGGAITMRGKAQSNARVSNYMWNVENSEWLADPNLDVIQTANQEGGRISDFTMRAKQARPGPAKAEGEAGQ